MLLKMKSLGFNFNDPYVMKKMITLKKYIDVSDIKAYNIVLKQLNFNNPYFEEILKKSYSIGLRWGDMENGVYKIEQQIFNDSQIPKNVDKIIQSFNKQNVSVNVNMYNIYGITIDMTDKDIKSKLPEFFKRLNLLKEYNINKGWKFGNTLLNTNTLSANDYNTMLFELKNTDGNYLKTTNNINHTQDEISFDELSGIYGNFDNLGLNIKDPQFKIKFDKIFNDLKIVIDSTVMLDTTKEIILTYTDFEDDNKKISINLANNKIDSKIFTISAYNAKITITDVANSNTDIQPTNSLVQFNVLQRLGFNFQSKNYYKFIDKMNGLKLNLTKIE